jgi:hypothetical protein
LFKDKNNHAIDFKASIGQQKSTGKKKELGPGKYDPIKYPKKKSFKCNYGD